MAAGTGDDDACELVSVFRVLSTRTEMMLASMLTDTAFYSGSPALDRHCSICITSPQADRSTRSCTGRATVRLDQRRRQWPDPSSARTDSRGQSVAVAMALQLQRAAGLASDSPATDCPPSECQRGRRRSALARIGPLATFINHANAVNRNRMTSAEFCHLLSQWRLDCDSSQRT